MIDLVDRLCGDHFGVIDGFHFATTREEALASLDLFIADRLPDFGTWQDAMVDGEPWMYHAHIGLYLNAGLLEPREVIHAAEDAWHRGEAPLNAVEGFIRQILGWREYVRSIYWLTAEYATRNSLERRAPCPNFTGQPKPICAASLNASRKPAIMPMPIISSGSWCLAISPCWRGLIRLR